MNLENILEIIGAQYRLHPNGPHGLSHWGRVLEIGLRLAEHTQADTKVVTLFSVFHDACRQNDALDPNHGRRGARLAETILGQDGMPSIQQHQLDLLVKACELHTDGYTEADVTVQTCWDADRLDLARVQIQPKPKFLCTELAKDQEVIWWASDRARRGYVPEFVEQDWERWFGRSSN